MVVFHQNRTDLQITFPQSNLTFNAKISSRVFRKFTETVLRWIPKMLSLDLEFASYYEQALIAYFRTGDVRLVLNEEMVQKCTAVARAWVEKNLSPSSISKEGVLNESQIRTLYTVSFALKLLAPVLYTSAMLEEERNALFHRLSAPLRAQKIDQFLLEFIRLKFLARSSASIWSWLASNRFKNVDYYVLNTYNTVLKQILLQLIPGPNPIGYIKSVVEQSIYYLLVDVYVGEVKYSSKELKRVKYMSSYSLITKHAVRATLDLMRKTVREHYGSIPTHDPFGRTYNTRPIFQYVTLPFLSHLFEVPYVYFLGTSQSTMLNLYTSLFLDQYANNLVYLRRLTRAYCVPIESPKVRLSSGLKVLSQLYTSPYPLNKVFESTQVFDTVLKDITSHEYWSFDNHQKIELTSVESLGKELYVFYDTLYSRKWSTVFDTLKSNGLELPGGSLLWQLT
jgi:hypothetical protein